MKAVCSNLIYAVNAALKLGLSLSEAVYYAANLVAEDDDEMEKYVHMINAYIRELKARNLWVQA